MWHVAPVRSRPPKAPVKRHSTLSSALRGAPLSHALSMRVLLAAAMGPTRVRAALLYRAL